MRGRSWVTALAAVLIWAGSAAADFVSMQMEFEGTLVQNSNQLVLVVEGEGSWNLQFDEQSPPDAARALQKFIGKKTRVTGSVQLRTAGNQLQVRDRTVRFRYYLVGWGAKIESITAGYPAAGKLEVNDVILEVQGKKTDTYDRLIEVLNTFRGQSVKLVVVHKGLSKVVEVALRDSGPLLGVTGQTAWGGPDTGSASEQSLIPAPAK
jgi:phosphoglycolate phosphatase-like HAD superfamily hydrolase